MISDYKSSVSIESYMTLSNCKRRSNDIWLELTSLRNILYSEPEYSLLTTILEFNDVGILVTIDWCAHRLADQLHCNQDAIPPQKRSEILFLSSAGGISQEAESTCQ